MGKKGKKGSLEGELQGPARYLNTDAGDPSENKHALYQRAVQSPKGDISYLVKFFLNYVGGRVPLHLREDFCGTALICTEWLRADARRTATGLDFDEEALQWGLAHNLSTLANGASSRICMLHGNVLEDIRTAKQVLLKSQSSLEPDVGDQEVGERKKGKREKGKRKGKPKRWKQDDSDSEADEAEAAKPEEGKGECTEIDSTLPAKSAESISFEKLEVSEQEGPEAVEESGQDKTETVEGNKQHKGEAVAEDGVSRDTVDLQVAPADIICAFNFSTCCLHSRSQLLTYFRHVRASLGKKGGVFAMDLYGGASSECALKLKRSHGDFTYTWEQEEFDAVSRETRISLHFKLEANKKVIRRAFSYHWRLWTIPEVKESLLEAGFDSIHVWMREMPELLKGGGMPKRRDNGEDDGEEVEMESNRTFVEVTRFAQTDSWNAYIVAIP